MNEYRSIDISAWTKVGEGGNGSVYVHPSEPDLILKVNRHGLNTEAFVRHEFEVSQAVECLGIPTPRMLEMVRVGDGFGTLSERIKNKKSLSRLCADAPERTEEIARVLCEQFKTLSSTPCKTDFFPNRKAQLLRAVDKVRFVGKKNREILRAFAETVPEVTTCSHGDVNMGNLISSDGQYLWIDLDRFGYGSPMFDLGHLYQICHDYASMKRVQGIFHMSEEQLRRFWEAFAKAYTGQEDHTEFDRQAARFACLDLVVRREFTPPRLAEELFFSVMIRRSIKNYYL